MSRWLSLEWMQLKRMVGLGPTTPNTSMEGQIRYSRETDVDGKLYLAKHIAGHTYEWDEIPALADPGADRILFWDDSAGKYEYLQTGANLSITGTTIAATTTGATIEVDEGGSKVNDATVLNFDATDFNVSNSPAGTANVSLAYGTSANTPAEGNHTHAGSSIVVSEGGTPTDSATTTINFDATDFNTTSSPAGTANVALAYGTSANTPAEGNHNHDTDYVNVTGDTMTGALVVNVASTNALKIQDGGTDVFLFETTNDRLHGHSGADVVLYSDAGITETIGIYGGNGELVFGGTSVTDVSIRSGSGSPEGALSAVVGSLFLRSDGSTNTAVYRKESGTGNTGWVAISAVSGGATIVVQEGDVDVDTAVATLDFDASDFNVTSSPAGEANIALAYGTSAGTPAEGNHSHALEDLSDVTATSPGAIAGKVLTWDGSSAWDDNFVYTESLGPWFLNDVPGTATTAMGLPYFNTATALSRSTNPMRAGRTGYIVGARITADAARSAGTCTVQVLLNGAGTAFDSGSVVLDGTRTTQDASIVTPGSGIAITSGSDTIGVQVVTSGWTPTTANIQVTLLVMWAPI